MEFIDLKEQYTVLKNKIDLNIHSVLDSGQYMMGNFVKQLEVELADYVGCKYCVTCANGTDALQMALMVWDVKEGDAVFLPSFTFYATAEVVSLLGATPIFVDSYGDTFNIDVEKLEKAIVDVQNEGVLTPRIIIPVDLFGQSADYPAIKKVAQKYSLHILEDGAQGFGGSINGKMTCSFGDISTTSFFPAKPLGCYGDGGAVFTDNEEYYNILLSLRVHGKGEIKYDNIRVGLNSRLDTIQAAVLLPKLEAFKTYELGNRNISADLYTVLLKDFVRTPYVPKGYVSSWAQYTILLNNKHERDALKEKLQQVGIPTMIYYPIPMHQQIVYKGYDFNLNDLKKCEYISERCLSLPMHPYLNQEDINFIVEEIKINLKNKEM